MSQRYRLFTLASIGALSLALHGGIAGAVEAKSSPGEQGGKVEATQTAAGSDATATTAASSAASAEPATTSTAATPPMAGPVPPPLPPEVKAHYEELQKQYEKNLEERNRRYQELRSRAEAAGVALPETPPWEQPPMPEPRWMSYEEMREHMGQQGVRLPETLGTMPAEMLSPPEPPTPPPAPTGPRSAEDWETMREQHYAQMRERAKARGVEMPETPPWKLGLLSDEERAEFREKMRTLGPAERQAYRQEMWTKMRERAKEKGLEFPEMPPGQFSQAPGMDTEQWERYQAIIEQMTPEQREAAQAVFSAPMCRRMMPSSWGPQAQPETPVQPPMGFTPGPQGYGMQPTPQYGAPQGGWPGAGEYKGYGPSAPQVPTTYGPGFGPTPGFGQGYEVPRAYGPGYGGAPQGFGPNSGSPEGYGPSYGGTGQMMPPPPPSEASPAGPRY